MDAYKQSLCSPNLLLRRVRWMMMLEELKSKRIRVCSGAKIEGDATVHLPDFSDQRAPLPEPRAKGVLSSRAPPSWNRRGGGGGGQERRDGVAAM